MINKKIITLMVGGSMALMSLMGCSIKSDTIIPEELITNVMKASEKPKSFYGEMKMQVYDNGSLQEDFTMKEWVDNSSSKIKRRLENESKGEGKVVTTNDGDKIISYMEKDKKALTIKVDNELSSNYLNYKDQLIRDLGNISKTHELTFKNEENVNGFKTYHLSAKPKDKNSIRGNEDYWIDKEHWFLIKVTSEMGNNKTNMEYTKVDFSPKLNENLFIQNLPSDVKIEDVNQTVSENEKSIDLKEAASIAGKPILCIQGNANYTLKNVKFMNFERMKLKEIDQTYEKNGVEAFILSTMVVGDKEQDKDDTKLPGEKEIDIRGTKGKAMDAEIRTVTWSEDGLNYSLLVQDSKLTLEDAKKLVESLSLSK